MDNIIFCDISPGSRLEIHRHFRKHPPSENGGSIFLRASVNFYRTTRRNFTEDSILNISFDIELPTYQHTG
jgi:hypothetical protein